MLQLVHLQRANNLANIDLILSPGGAAAYCRRGACTPTLGASRPPTTKYCAIIITHHNVTQGLYQC